MKFQKLAFFFLLSIATQIPGIFNPILDYHGWAQTLRASTARNYYEHGMRFFHPELDYVMTGTSNSVPQLPLYSYLLALLYKIFGLHDFLGRWLSAFFAACSAVFLYLLARSYLEEEPAFWGAVVFCFIPIRIYFTRTVMPESMAIFSLVAGLYFLRVWTEKEKFFPYGALGGLLLLLVPLLKLPYLPLLLPAFALLWFKWGKSVFLRKDFLITAAAVLACFFGWYSYSNAGHGQIRDLVSWLGVVMNLAREWTDAEFWSQVFVSRFPELLTTYAGLLFFAVGFRSCWAGKKWFLIAWFFGTVFYALLCGNYIRVHQYASLPFAPVNAVLIGAGIAKMRGQLSAKKWGMALLVLLVVSMPVHAFFRIRHWYRLDELWVLKAQRVVAEKTFPEDLFYVDAKDQPFFLYHLHRKGYVGDIGEVGMGYFESALKGGVKFFFAPAGGNFKNIRPAFDARFPIIYGDSDFVLYRVDGK